MSSAATTSALLSQALMQRNVADRTERCPGDFLGALGDIVGHRENLSRVLIQEQGVLAEMPPAHVPVEILCLQVDEHVGQLLPKSA